jgi:4-coumarate--CoA ligase
VKGPVVTKGYYRNPQATKDSFVDGWFCTGDIAVWKNGLPYIVDRKKVRIAPYPPPGIIANGRK